MDDEDETGVDGAVEALSALEIAIEAGAGITYFDDPRDDGKTNKEILEYHKQGIRTRDGLVIRDITLTEEDSDKAAEVFQKSYTEYIEKLQAARQPKKTTKKRGGALRQGLRRGLKGNTTGKDDAKQALAGSLRKAAKALVEVFQERWQGQVSNTGTKLQKVSEDYGDQRMKKHGVGHDVVFLASGQLGRGIEQGKYDLFFDPSKVDEIKNNIVG